MSVHMCESKGSKSLATGSENDGLDVEIGRSRHC